MSDILGKEIVIAATYLVFCTNKQWKKFKDEPDNHIINRSENWVIKFNKKKYVHMPDDHPDRFRGVGIDGVLILRPISPEVLNIINPMIIVGSY